MPLWGPYPHKAPHMNCIPTFYNALGSNAMMARAIPQLCGASRASLQRERENYSLASYDRVLGFLYIYRTSK
eukprot:scaffold215434_cov47-Attheya_sp.AAC.1